MNITLNINIESINITLNAQAPLEPVLTAEPEAVQEDVQEIDTAPSLFNKYRLSEKLRAMLGNEAANRYLGGI
ncbi:hypothetical protein [Pseudomonas sp. LB3P38]|uniref:hypothetical protein n=1 Tax=Pseudomonas lyxosi TaxID=3398358 RepID=UPI0039EEB5E3